MAQQSEKQPNGSNHPVHKTLASASNLANLLPTGTVLSFQALTPSFTNNGTCQLSNQYLTACLVASCALACFLSFTDSFTGSDGKLYHGIATFKGLYLFNDGYVEEEEKDLFIDFVHAFLSLFVFFIFAFSNSIWQDNFFPKGGANERVLITNMPLGAGVLPSFLFTIFPSTRKGVGYGDMGHLA